MVDPLHQFIISPILNINIGGMDLSFTNSSLSVLLAFLSICALLTFGLRKRRLVPDRVQALVEVSYGVVADLIDKNVGRSGLRYFPFVFSVFSFILFGNLLGIVPHVFTFTSHIIVTFTLAMVVFLFVTVLGICLHGWHFFTLFAPRGVPKAILMLLIPIELISYMFRPISLSVRLFANMLAGHAMMKVFAGLAVMSAGGIAVSASGLGAVMGAFTPIAISTILTGFEIFVAMFQAYIFTILTCVYLNDAVHLH